MRKKSEYKKLYIAGIGTLGAAGLFVWLGFSHLSTVTYTASDSSLGVLAMALNTDGENPSEEAKEIVTHIDTPEPVKAIYMTQCVVGTPSFRSDLVHIAETTEINSIVIDIKDFSGGIGFVAENPILKPYVSTRCHARDMKDFIQSLHDRGIYVIGRITVFQDPLYTEAHPYLSVQKASDRSIWSDYKGIHFIDPGATEYWDYIVELSREAYAIGFDELNFDYIRYPSDGPMRDIYYPKSQTRVDSAQYGKALVIRDFFEYIHERMQEIGVKTSADLFGMTTTNTDDLNIGQILEYALPYFDYVAPMVYPSHYPDNFNGWKDPDDYPYELVKFAMSSAVDRVHALQTSTSTPEWIREKLSPLQLRTWIQDFDYGGIYDIPEVRAQIQATYDAGLSSWMVWAPSNRYTIGALEKE